MQCFIYKYLGFGIISFLPFGFEFDIIKKTLTIQTVRIQQNNVRYKYIFVDCGSCGLDFFGFHLAN